MKHAAEYARRLKQLLRKLRSQVTVPQVPDLDPVEQLVHAFLCWECSRNQADQALPKLLRMAVDLNDLRVSDPRDMAQAIGAGYHLSEDRTLRIKLALNSVYGREHAMDLSGLKQMPKREARQYLWGLDGMVPFVAASVCLFSFRVHAVPLDDQLLRRLQKDEVVDPEAPLADVLAFLENQVRADEAVEAHYLLRAYVERPIKVTLTRRSLAPKTAAVRKKKAAATKKTTQKAARTGQRKKAAKVSVRAKPAARKKSTRKTRAR
ncbi:MAG: hypothetical protein OER86_00375 [Phycisphaerae bacterium]|nr:hypothetical protein [Phycisphaerae bacterium]